MPERGRYGMNDFVITDCTVVDPLNEIKRQTAVAIRDGKISEVGDGVQGRRYASFPGAVLMPGIIDTHVHCADWIGGPLSFGMLARAGVATAVDLAGPARVVLDLMAEYGSGINLAVIEALYPGVSVEGNDPTREEIRSVLERAVRDGALGLKLIGGHYPLTPEASSAAIRAATDRRCYVAVHSGSTLNGSNMKGVLDSIEFADGRPFHLAHINAYCRGMVLEDPKDELKVLLGALTEHPEIISESHLGPYNGTNGRCVKGVPESHITRNCLRMGGYPETEEGLRRAFADGYALCVWEDLKGVNEYVAGQAALDYWTARGQDVVCSFPVNDREIAFLCATARNADRGFIIDALSSDGGGIPRNFMISYGYLLVEWGAWSLDEYVRKNSLVPARMLGLPNKGHLSQGADADITVFDPTERRVLLTMVGGRIVYAGGALLGSGGALLCLEEGGEAARKRGLSCQAVDLERSMLYGGR